MADRLLQPAIDFDADQYADRYGDAYGDEYAHTHDHGYGYATTHIGSQPIGHRHSRHAPAHYDAAAVRHAALDRYRHANPSRAAALSVAVYLTSLAHGFPDAAAADFAVRAYFGARAYHERATGADGEQRPDAGAGLPGTSGWNQLGLDGAGRGEVPGPAAGGEPRRAGEANRGLLSDIDADPIPDPRSHEHPALGGFAGLKPGESHRHAHDYDPGHPHWHPNLAGNSRGDGTPFPGADTNGRPSIFAPSRTNVRP
jgi:hypothetical protein